LKRPSLALFEAPNDILGGLGVNLLQIREDRVGFWKFF
jgi:hypothetical protein